MSRSTVATYVPSVRGDAMLLTHGREGTELLLGAALVLDGILGGQLDVTTPGLERRRSAEDGGGFDTLLERRRLIAGPERAESPLMAELRARVMSGPPEPPRDWILRAALFAPARVAAEIVAAGVASPLERRFQGRHTLSIDARAEADARTRLLSPDGTVLAALLHTHGVLAAISRDPFPPASHTLPPAARAVIAALRA
jgi:hypothetical protein